MACEEGQDDAAHQEAFVAYCEARQKEYRRVFGKEEPEGQICSLPVDLFFQWPGGGVFKFPPRKSRKRPHWHYVTEALTQPDDPVAAIRDGDPYYSFELVLSTAEEAHWPIAVLMNIGRYYRGPKGRPFYPWQYFPCNGPLVLETDTALNHLITVRPREYDPVITLPGGECNLIHLVGVAEDELKPSLELEKGWHGIEALHRVLCNRGIGSCSIPERPSLAKDPTFRAEWEAELAKVQAEADD